MIHTLKLGGETRTLLFGNLAFKKLKEETGITLSVISKALIEQDITIVADVLYYALRAAERYEKKTPGEYDAEEVALWMDMERGVTTLVLPWMLEAIEDMTGQTETDEPELPYFQHADLIYWACYLAYTKHEAVVNDAKKAAEMEKKFIEAFGQKQDARKMEWRRKYRPIRTVGQFF